MAMTNRSLFRLGEVRPHLASCPATHPRSCPPGLARPTFYRWRRRLLIFFLQCLVDHRFAALPNSVTPFSCRPQGSHFSILRLKVVCRLRLFLFSGYCLRLRFALSSVWHSYDLLAQTDRIGLVGSDSTKNGETI